MSRAALSTSIVASGLQPGVLVHRDQLAGVDERIVQFDAVTGCLVAGDAPDAWRVLRDQLLCLREEVLALAFVNRALCLEHQVVDRVVAEAMYIRARGDE